LELAKTFQELVQGFKPGTGVVQQPKKNSPFMKTYRSATKLGEVTSGQ